MSALTAAHKTLPLPSIVEVTNLDNGRRLKVRVNDRGPFVDGRILDLSRAAAFELGFARAGLARVRVRYVGPAPLGGPDGGGLRLAAAPAPQISRAQISSPQISRPQPSQILTLQPPLAAANRYEVVVGAFANLSSAQKLVDRVAPAGVAMVKPVQRDGVTLYRVVVGALADEAKALAVREQMLAFGLGDARIVYPN
jgi:rare lipoprotein A